MKTMSKNHLIFYKRPDETDNQLSFDFLDEKEKWVGPLHVVADDSEKALNLFYELKDKGYTFKYCKEKNNGIR